MAVVTTYDPQTLTFLSDFSPGKKQYNPNPRSRIPRNRPARAVVQKTVSSVKEFQQAPIYLLSVISGREEEVARHLRQAHPGVGVIIPRSAQGVPLMPGSLFLAMEVEYFHPVATSIREQRWGWLSAEPLDRASIQPFLVLDESSVDNGDEIPQLKPDHPVRVMAQALLQHTFSQSFQEDPENSWVGVDANGIPFASEWVRTLYQELWRDWQAQQPLVEILGRHRAQLEGAVVSITLVETSRHQEWVGMWCGQRVRIPRTEHLFTRPRTRTVDAVILGIKPLTASLTHPEILRYRVTSQVSYRDVARVPGRWAAFLVPQADSHAKQRLHQLARTMGNQEQWQAVSDRDPAHLVQTLLQPQRITFHRDQRRIQVHRMASDRKAWRDTAQRWLPEWTLAEG